MLGPDDGIEVGAADGTPVGFKLGFVEGAGESVGIAEGGIEGWPEVAREGGMLGYLATITWAVAITLGSSGSFNEPADPRVVAPTHCGAESYWA